MSDIQCSELFSEIFSSGCGGCLRTCDCGITYFDGYNNWDWEVNELENLRQKAKDDPRQYIEQDHSVSTMEIGGAQIVHGCSCGQAQRYETFILNHAVQLADYLNKRASMLKEKAKLIKVDKE